MNISIEEQNGTVRLAGAFDLYAAEKVHRSFLEQLASRPELVLDLAAVTACDASGLQLLCSLRKTALECGRTIRVEGISPAISECCENLGLGSKDFTFASR